MLKDHLATGTSKSIHNNKQQQQQETEIKSKQQQKFQTKVALAIRQPHQLHRQIIIDWAGTDLKSKHRKKEQIY